MFEGYSIEELEKLLNHIQDELKCDVHFIDNNKLYEKLSFTDQVSKIKAVSKIKRRINHLIKKS